MPSPGNDRDYIIYVGFDDRRRIWRAEPAEPAVVVGSAAAAAAAAAAPQPPRRSRAAEPAAAERAADADDGFVLPVAAARRD